MIDLEQKQITINHKLFYEAKKYIPGGVNSPVRSFNSVGGCPVFVRNANGSKIYGENGAEFIDYCLSWGVLIFGHTHPEIISAIHKVLNQGTSFGTATKSEIELAKLIIEAVPSIEQVRLTNSGTEAVMSAVRLARAFIKKNKIIKFEGAYHGHADYLLVKGGSGLATSGVPSSLGVPKDFSKHTIVVPYNDIKEVEKAVKKYHKDLAGIIVEPVLANCGLIRPLPGFLEGLRDIADRYNLVLIFDEVITGFRLAYGGAQEYFNIRPDLTCLGKIIGGGLPVGAFGGRKEIMKLLAPLGGVYQAGTLSGNPLAVAAGIATLNILRKINPYENLKNKTKELCDMISASAKNYKINLKVNYIGSLFSFFFVDKEVRNYTSASFQDLRLFKKFYHSLLNKKIYLSPSGFETNFLSCAHTDDDIDKTLKAVNNTFKRLTVFYSAGR